MSWKGSMNIPPIYSMARPSRCLGVASILLLSLLATGCGKKTFPQPVSHEPPPRIADLYAQVRSKGVELSWTIPPQMKVTSKESQQLFSVLRSELKWENRNCADCPPPLQQEVQVIDPTFPEPAVISGNKMIWTDTAVSRQHAYRYQVVIRDKQGRPSVFSNPVVARVLAPPALVTGTAAATGPQGIMLQWKPPKTDDQGQALKGDLHFEIERTLNGKTWERVNAVPIKANNFLDQGVAAEQTYEYRVVPVLTFEETAMLGEPSELVRVRAPEALPPPPPGTVWVIPAKGALEVQWTESEGKVGGYHVYRREGKEITRLTAAPIQKPPYLDHSARPNTVYYYAVSSVGPQPDHREGLLSKWAEIRSILFE